MESAGNTSQSAEDSKEPATLSSAKSEPGLKSVSAEERKLMQFVTETQYSRRYAGTLKGIYTRYGSAQSALQTISRIELTQYLRFMTDSGITPGILPRAQLEVLFSHRNRSKSISFWRWVDILAEVARGKYRTQRPLQGLSQLLEEVVFAAPLIRKDCLPIDQWEEQLQDPEVLPVVQASRPLFDRLAHLFRSKDFSSRGRVPLTNILIFAQQFRIVPDLISQVTVTRVFRAVVHDPFSEYLETRDFAKFCYFLGPLSFPDKSVPAAISEVVAWVRLSEQKLRVMERTGSKALRLS